MRRLDDEKNISMNARRLGLKTDLQHQLESFDSNVKSLDQLKYVLSHFLSSSIEYSQLTGAGDDTSSGVNVEIDELLYQYFQKIISRVESIKSPIEISKVFDATVLEKIFQLTLLRKSQLSTLSLYSDMLVQMMGGVAESAIGPKEVAGIIRDLLAENDSSQALQDPMKIFDQLMVFYPDVLGVQETQGLPLWLELMYAANPNDVIELYNLTAIYAIRATIYNRSETQLLGAAYNYAKPGFKARMNW